MRNERVVQVAQFEDHVHRAKKNLEVLGVLNRYSHVDYSWQVTLCFYTAVHLINSHLSYVAGETFNTHVSTLNRIDPGSPLNIHAVSHTAYKAYLRLHNRSCEAAIYVTWMMVERSSGIITVLSEPGTGI